MRTKVLVVTAFLLVFSNLAIAEQPLFTAIDRPDMPSFVGYVQGEIIVQLKPIEQLVQPVMPTTGAAKTGIASLDDLVERYQVIQFRQQFRGAEPRVWNGRTIDLSRYYKVSFDPDADLEEVMDAYRRDPNVESVEPIGIHTTYATPNDGYFSEQWHLSQSNDHDIDAPEAWDIETGSDGIVVAILDSGVRYFHKDLGGANASYSNPGASRGNMWINWTEKNGTSGVDDDNNGYTDDWIGWDFVDGGSDCYSGEDCYTQDNDPRDFNGHGTHCAGNVAAGTNDGYGTCGVAGGWSNGSLPVTGNGVKIMPCRVGWSANHYLYGEVGYVRMDFAAEAFYYAADNGAVIASCSWGSSNTGGLGAAVDYFINSGGLILKAAGNDGSTSADYMCGRSDVISVAATDSLDNGADFTTYGSWVDICAPGTNIWSSYHDHDYPQNDYVAAMSGTSMSTPMAAGVTALIWSQNPGWSASQVEAQLYSSADNIDAYLSSKYIGNMGAGRINAYNAVQTGPSGPQAAFYGSPTSGYAPLTVYFTDQSTGDITSWEWDFGDNTTSYLPSPSHEYTTADKYTVSLTVSGPGGEDTEVKTDYITVSEPGQNLMHVNAVIVTKYYWWILYYAEVDVQIVDGDGYPVPNATVTGEWSGGYSGTDQFTTGSDGWGWSSTPWKWGNATYTFCVTNVTKTDWTYDPDANVVTCSRSDGTSWGRPVETAEVDIEEIEEQLGQKLVYNRPNPFNMQTEISFYMPEPGHVDVDIYNILGRKVAGLLDKNVEAGVTSVTWNATDESGCPVASGIYFYSITFNDRKTLTNRMMLIK